MKKSLLKDTSAQSGLIWFIPMTIGLFALIWIILGAPMDVFHDWHMTTTDLYPMSEQRSDTVEFAMKMYDKAPYFVMLLILVTVIIVSVRKRSGEI